MRYSPAPPAPPEVPPPAGAVSDSTLPLPPPGPELDKTIPAGRLGPPPELVAGNAPIEAPVAPAQVEPLTLPAATVAAAAPAAVTGWNPFVPMLIALLGLASWGWFQFYQLRMETTSLGTLRASQEAPLEKAHRMRQTFDALAQQTKKLADGGNPSAKLVIDELAKRGVTVNLPPPAASPK